MEKRRRGETEIPEAIIQHIQSFLDGKEAARTTILSKSWYNAWLSRPNLVFDQRYFRELFLETKKFSEWSRKTLQRYRDLNLKIDSFKFRMRWSQKACYPLANELVVEAIKMGATDISFKLYQTLTFVLPRGVLESESLIRLSVKGCKIEDVKFGCSSLVHLSLRQVFLEGDLFWDIISSCPLIEELKLRECKCLLKKRKVLLNLSKQNLIDGPINLFELHKLKSLLLEKIKICRLFFSDFVSRFPCLKDLTVRHCSGYKKIQIYSQSLESISFVHLRMILNAELDVPNLGKFCFSGESLLPCVLFPSSHDWESDISISCCDDLSAKWLLNLNKLLTNLRLSKVTLFLQYKYVPTIDNAGSTLCLPKPLVKNLKIDVRSSVCAAVFDSLLRWCRPVFVTQYQHPYGSDWGGNSIEFLDVVYKRLMQQICTKNQDDLKEVSVGVFDRAVSRWRTVPWKSVLEDTSTAKRRRIRFHLKWGKD